MHVIHFTEGATDPLKQFFARGARFVPLADGFGDYHISCLHLTAAGRIPKLPMTQDCTLLIVQGDLVFESSEPSCRLELSAGVGVVLEAGEQIGLESRKGGILILVQGHAMEAHECGVSTPQRIAAPRWPGKCFAGDGT
jgi:hypothetical protein